MSAVQFFFVTVSLAPLLICLFLPYDFPKSADLFGSTDFQSFLGGRCKVSFFDFPTEYNNCEDIQHYCGDTPFKLKFPFRFEGDPRSCGEPEVELSCRHNRTILHMKRELEGDYYVDVNSIDYERRTFQVTDPGVRKNDCSTLPFYSFNPSYPLSRDQGRREGGARPAVPLRRFSRNKQVELVVKVTMQALVFVRCKRQPKRNLLGDVSYIDTAPCNISANQFSSHHSKSSQIYAVLNLSWPNGGVVAPRDIQESCTITKIVPIQMEYGDFQNKSGNLSFQDIHNLLVQGYRFNFYLVEYKKVDWGSSFLCYLGAGLWNLVTAG